MSSVLVVGIGNAWRSDDAAGLSVVRGLGTLPPGAAAREWEGEPMGLIEAWEGFDAVVLVDAVASESSPGAVHRVEAAEKPLDAELFQTSTHTISIAETIELARALDRLPSRVVVFGIEGGSFAAGEGLSPPVAQAVPQVVAAVREEVKRCTSRS